MFEKLEAIRPDLKPMFGGLRKADPHVVHQMRAQHPECPDSYWSFLLERGTGTVEQEGEPFYFQERLLSAELEVFRDRQIFDNGARGDVMIFGHESMGTAYGFDTGRDWSLVEVDEMRIVTPLALTFAEFVEGLVLCYPQIAIKTVDGEWIDGVGNRYTLSL